MARGPDYVAGMDQTQALAACAALVEHGDPDRFLAAMAAPRPARAPLLVLAAFNLELARAPWVTREPLIARMRLQFWRDVLAGEESAAHEVAGPVRALAIERALDPALLAAMIDAREAEIGVRAPFADEAALWAYLEGGAGALLALSVQALGGPKSGPESGPESGPVSAAVRGLGAAQGLANYLMAIPALEGAGRQPLPDGRPEAVAALARAGLVRIDAARTDLRALPKPARPALLAAWRARAILAQAAARPGAVAAGDLGQSEFARRGSLLWRAWVGWR